MWQNYYQPTSLTETLALLQQYAGQARLVAGGTDLIVELQRGIRPTTTVIDVTALTELRYVRRQADTICVGALATHNDIVASPLGLADALPLAQSCLEVGAPQIRARGTVAGNLVTASPANDTITALMALDAEVVLVSKAGERRLSLRDFYLGVRRTALAPHELLREIRFPALGADQRGIFLKLGLRRAQAISVINLAVVVRLAADATVTEARIALGCLAPTIVRAPEAEASLVGRALDASACAEAGVLARRAVRPIDDLRGSAEYRLNTLEALVGQALSRIATGTQAAGWPARPVLLETGDQIVPGGPPNQPLTMIETTINGHPYRLELVRGKTLLDFLREDIGLTGTKEGCAEGECGACTVWLNGQAVMACLVPAPQAHGATITTIEGLGNEGALHPLQAAFIANGAVQCGYCIPGMLMAGAKLLDELPAPDTHEMQAAISGNICRCTGYRKILDALAEAADRLKIED